MWWAMLLQLISLLGALMGLSAYGLIQGGVWSELNAGYHALNIVGSLLLGIVKIADQRVGFIFLELRGQVWDWSASPER